MDFDKQVAELGQKAQAAASGLAKASTENRDAALGAIASSLEQHSGRILTVNAQDVAKARTAGTESSMLDRLALSPERIQGMATAVRELIAMPDPIGVISESWVQASGVNIQKVSVPLGVVGMIYEARPNVTVDAATICLKSGNASVLRGSASALATNILLVELMDTAIRSAGLPGDSVQLLTDPDREAAKALMRARGSIDVLIPRGGAELIRTVVNEATVPVIETGVGNCHVYLDESCDPTKALPIVINSKTHRPSVCNSAETLLVHEGVAKALLPEIGVRLQELGVELRGDDRSRKLVGGMAKATEADWSTEFLDLIMAVKVVPDLASAIDHINFYGSRHTEAIVAEDQEAAEAFIAGVDAAAVIVNASTRFTDGGEFGFGAEIGISTQKVHARGPMGIRELTSYKYVLKGDGQVRK